MTLQPPNHQNKSNRAQASWKRAQDFVLDVVYQSLETMFQSVNVYENDSDRLVKRKAWKVSQLFLDHHAGRDIKIEDGRHLPVRHFMLLMMQSEEVEPWLALSKFAADWVLLHQDQLTKKVNSDFLSLMNEIEELSVELERRMEKRPENPPGGTEVPPRQSSTPNQDSLQRKTSSDRGQSNLRKMSKASVYGTQQDREQKSQEPQDMSSTPRQQSKRHLSILYAPDNLLRKTSIADQFGFQDPRKKSISSERKMSAASSLFAPAADVALHTKLSPTASDRKQSSASLHPPPDHFTNSVHAPAHIDRNVSTPSPLGRNTSTNLRKLSVSPVNHRSQTPNPGPVASRSATPLVSERLNRHSEPGNQALDSVPKLVPELVPEGGRLTIKTRMVKQLRERQGSVSQSSSPTFQRRHQTPDPLPEGIRKEQLRQSYQDRTFFQLNARKLSFDPDDPHSSRESGERADAAARVVAHHWKMLVEARSEGNSPRSQSPISNVILQHKSLLSIDRVKSPSKLAREQVDAMQKRKQSNASSGESSRQGLGAVAKRKDSSASVLGGRKDSNASILGERKGSGAGFFPFIERPKTGATTLTGCEGLSDENSKDKILDQRWVPAGAGKGAWQEVEGSVHVATPQQRVIEEEDSLAEARISTPEVGSSDWGRKAAGTPLKIQPPRLSDPVVTKALDLQAKKYDLHPVLGKDTVYTGLVYPWMECYMKPEDKNAEQKPTKREEMKRIRDSMHVNSRRSSRVVRRESVMESSIHFGDRASSDSEATGFRIQLPERQLMPSRLGRREARNRERFDSSNRDFTSDPTISFSEPDGECSPTTRFRQQSFMQRIEGRDSGDSSPSNYEKPWKQRRGKKASFMKGKRNGKRGKSRMAVTTSTEEDSTDDEQRSKFEMKADPFEPDVRMKTTLQRQVESLIHGMVPEIAGKLFDLGIAMEKLGNLFRDWHMSTGIQKAILQYPGDIVHKSLFGESADYFMDLRSNGEARNPALFLQNLKQNFRHLGLKKHPDLALQIYDDPAAQVLQEVLRSIRSELLYQMPKYMKPLVEQLDHEKELSRQRKIKEEIQRFEKLQTNKKQDWASINCQIQLATHLLNRTTDQTDDEVARV